MRSKGPEGLHEISKGRVKETETNALGKNIH